MYIPLDKRLEDNRQTRVVIGLPFCMDISSIFENEEVDFLDSKPITHENFDNDDIFFIQKNGYVKRKSLLDYGFVAIACGDLDESIVETMLIEK